MRLERRKTGREQGSTPFSGRNGAEGTWMRAHMPIERRFLTNTLSKSSSAILREKSRLSVPP